MVIPVVRTNHDFLRHKVVVIHLSFEIPVFQFRLHFGKTGWNLNSNQQIVEINRYGELRIASKQFTAEF